MQATASEESPATTPSGSDGTKSKSKDEGKAIKSKAKPGSSSSKKSSSSKHKSPAGAAAAMTHSTTPTTLPMMPDFSHPYPLPPFPAAVQLRPHFPGSAAVHVGAASDKAASSQQEQLIRLPTKPLDISEVSKNAGAATAAGVTVTTEEGKKSFVRPFEDAAAAGATESRPEKGSGTSYSGQQESGGGSSGDGKRDNVVKVPPFSNRQRIVVENNNNNNNENNFKKEEEEISSGVSSTSKEQFAVLR